VSESTESIEGSLAGPIVITGAAGFIGAHLAAKAINSGLLVVGIDREAERPSLSTNPNYRHYRMGLPSADLEDVCRRYAPELIIHAAGPSSVPESLIEPFADFAAAVPAVVSALDILRKQRRHTKFILLSSASVYGSPGYLPIREEEVPRPISPYGYHKYMCELAVEEFASLYGVRACIARIFSAYGPGLRRQVLWDICCKTMSDAPDLLFGTGQETRDFIHVSDISEGVYTLARAGSMSGGVYNLASGKQTSIAELALWLTQALGSGSSPEFSAQVREGDPRHWQADITKIMSLGFSPRVSLSDGVIEYARWFLSDESLVKRA